MPQLIPHQGLRSVKESWIVLYGDGGGYTAFQDYAYAQVVERFFRLSTRHRFKNVIYEVRDDEGRTVLLLPLHQGKNRAYLWGEFSQAGYLDVLSADEVKADALRFALEAIAGGRKDFEFLFSRVRAGCRLDRLIEACLSPEQYDRRVCPCAHIPLPKAYETYFNGLGKGYRQKLRASANHLREEGHTWDVEVFLDKPMPLGTQLRLFDLYWRRMSGKGINFKFRKFFPYFLRRWFNPTILALTRLPNTFHAILHIDGAVAGFCAGFTSRQGTITLPFLAIESRFSRYNPGGVLISATVRHLIENSDCTTFDLSRGDEKYKFDYGAVAHANCCFTIRLGGGVRSPGPA